MTDETGRAIGVGAVGLGLLALTLSAPGESRNLAASQAQPPAAEQRPAATVRDTTENAADELRAQTGDRLPGTEAGAAGVLAGWGDASRRAAQSILEKYGPPDETSESRLVWNNTGAFRRTIVYKEELRRRFPTPRADVLEQYVDYDVPYDKLGELARFNPSLRPDKTAGQLSARGPSEADNVIALNLAHELLQGRRTLADARAAYARLAALAESGRSSPYSKGLLFKTRKAPPEPLLPSRG
jgi:hypothetical protein